MPTSLTHVKVALIDGGLELDSFGQGVNLNLGSYSESLEYQKGRKDVAGDGRPPHRAKC